MKVLLCSLLVAVGVASGYPQDSYLAPLGAQSAPSLYSSPNNQAPSLYSGPSDAFNSIDYDFSVPNVGYSNEEAVSSYGAPADNSIDEVFSSYGSPSDPLITLSNSDVQSSYGASSSYGAASEAVSTYGSPEGAASQNVVSVKDVSSAASNPVNLVRSVHENDNHGNWHSMYEADNGIFQESKGEMKSIGDTQVHVMSGSYSYIGPDGQTYQVDWFADETGYHPSAPHLPRDVEIPFPEVAAAVADQLAYAAEQDALAAASNTNGVTINLGDYDDLAGYGTNDLAGYTN